jgi:hypothetical protein
VFALYPLLADPHDALISDILATIRSLEHKYVELKEHEAGASPPAHIKTTIYTKLDHLQSLQLVPAKIKD